MSRHRAPRRSALPWLRVLLAGTALAAGAVVLVSPEAAVPVVAERGTERAAAAPVRVRVSAVGVDSQLLRLGTDATGALVPPDDYDLAGWFTSGAVPGDVGPAVVAGHVDSVDGPAVFARIDELAPGDAVLVDRADGSTARFAVTDVARYPKSGFPTEAVYGPTPRAELRLVTCGGEFDRSRRSYVDNVVVTAVLTSW